MEFYLGLFLFAVIGAFLGNAMTTLVYRIPRAIPISGFAQKPKCGGCDMLLRAVDFIPLFRYIFVSKNCRCGKYIIPKTYFLIELYSAIGCAFAYFLWHDSALLLHKVLLVPALLMLEAIYSERGRIYDNALWVLSIVAMFYIFEGHNVDILQKLSLVGISFILLFLVSKIWGIQSRDFRCLFILLTMCDGIAIAFLVPAFMVSFAIYKMKAKLNPAPMILNINIFWAFHMFVVKFITI